MITAEAASKAIDALSMLRYFPANAGSALGRLLAEMCSDDEQVAWLVKRTLQLHGDWPGPVELRAILCSKYWPADGIDAYSRDPRFVDGIPSSNPLPSWKPQAALPPGRVVSDAASIDNAVADLARAKDINRAGPPPRVRDIPMLPANVKPITEADIVAAVEGLHEQRAHEELETNV